MPRKPSARTSLPSERAQYKESPSRRSQLCAVDELVVWKAFIQEPTICSVSSLLITLKKNVAVEISATASASRAARTEAVTVRGGDIFATFGVQTVALSSGTKYSPADLSHMAASELTAACAQPGGGKLRASVC